MPIDRITVMCFGASYGVALALELLQLLRPRGIQRLLGMVLAGAGILAHTLFLVVQQPPLSTQFGSLLFLAWILAVFYLYGSVHHGRLAWGVFVLPLVLGALAAHVRGSRTEMIPRATHPMFEQQPQKYCEIVLDFLAA